MLLPHRYTCLLHFRRTQQNINNWISKYTLNTSFLGRVGSVKLYATQQSQSDKMTEILRQKFPLAKEIQVTDVSGGCGSMFDIFVESVEFKGLPIVKQHRLINEILKDDIKQMHGLRIHTKIPN